MAAKKSKPAPKKSVKKTKTTAKPKVAVRKPAARPKTLVQEALEVTWLLKGNLKNIQIAYIRVGRLLAQVRDRKLYSELKHQTMEEYAEERLSLGRASMYRYLQVYDWVCKFHKEWLEPGSKGFIPDLSDATDLIWIENELSRKDISAERRAALEALRQKALAGKLRSGDLDGLRGQTGVKTQQSLKTFLSKFRTLRRRCIQVKCVPAEAVQHIESAIEIILSAMSLEKSGLTGDEGGR